jgi:hypothetical protein
VQVRLTGLTGLKDPFRHHGIQYVRGVEEIDAPFVLSLAALKPGNSFAS